MSRSIPPLLPWQIESSNGTVHGSASALVVTATPVAGQLTVDMTTDKTGVHHFDTGDGQQFNSVDNTERHTYGKAGTYTITASTGKASGSATVTVPGAVADEQSTEDKGATRSTKKKG